MQRHTVLFQPDNIEIEVEWGTDLLTAVRQANIEIKCGCGGEGTCGKCLLRVLSGPVKMERQSLCEGFVIACQTRVAGDVVIEIPTFSRLLGHQVLLDSQSDVLTDALGLPSRFTFDPLCKKVSLKLSPPSLTDPSSDVSRLLLALRRSIGLSNIELDLNQVRLLAEVLRANNWQVDVTYVRVGDKVYVVSIDAAGHVDQLLGIAVDVGTTTVVVYLVDLLSGALIGKVGAHNQQAQFGDDVITRIIHGDEENNGLAELQQAVVGTIDDLVLVLVEKCKVRARDIKVMVAAGNTTMAHLLFGIQPRYIRLEPYVPTANHFPICRARELELQHVHPDAVVFNFPAVASYVGGDIIAGVLFNGMAEEEPVTLFVDIGTNGEMVLGNKDWLVSCSCSAGPAFEGAGVTCGMRAMQGAIEGLTIDEKTFEVTYSTIGGIRPSGICGSGLIDALAKMRKVGVIDRAGNMHHNLPTPRIRTSDAGIEFVLVWADEATDRDVVITEADVKNLLRAKGAVFAGIRSLLKLVDLDMSDIERIYIAGGFGNYLNINDAIEIGLLPDIGVNKYSFIGNSSVKGAYAALVASSALHEVEQLTERITYMELSAGNLFMEEFISAVFLPHTDLSLFPSVRS